MAQARQQLYKKCEQRLQELRRELQLRVRGLDEGAFQSESKGDDADLASFLRGQENSIAQRDVMLRKLREIDDALDRISQGTYGICDETGEPIDKERLLAVPWTRLSREGAAMREEAMATMRLWQR